MKLAIGIVASVAGMVPVKAAAHNGCHSLRCKERVAMKACSQTRPKMCLRRAAIHWRVSEGVLMRKTRCESGFNPYAYFGHPHNRTPKPWSLIVRYDLSTGLMEFKPGTWLTTPYARRDIWRAKWNALAGAWMHHVGRGGEWECAG